MRTVTVGSLTMTLPAAIIAAIGIVSAIAMVLYHPGLLLPSMVMLGVFFIAAYNINCTVVGHCETFAWILTLCFLVLLATSGALSFWAYKNMDPEKVMNAMELSHMRGLSGKLLNDARKTVMGKK